MSLYLRSRKQVEMDRFAQVAKLVPLCRLVSLEADCHLKRNAVNDSDYQSTLTL